MKKLDTIINQLHDDLEGNFPNDPFMVMVISKNSRSFLRLSGDDETTAQMMEAAKEQVDEFNVKRAGKKALVMFCNKLFYNLTPDQRRAILHTSADSHKLFKKILEDTNASELDGMESLANEEEAPDFSDPKAIEEWYKRQFKGGESSKLN